jgi:hypothetical protein
MPVYYLYTACVLPVYQATTQPRALILRFEGDNGNNGNTVVTIGQMVHPERLVTHSEAAWE